MDTKADSLLNKTAQVRVAFERPQKYLSRRGYDIRIRQETVQDLVKGKSFQRILDIGCGDGSISLPLLHDHNRLTLLDMSSSMLTLARSKVPVELTQNVELINDEFMAAPLDRAAYDLVLCLGVLAHVNSPEDIISKISSILVPGGFVILEFTDSYHVWGKVDLALQSLWTRIRPRTYELNCISKAYVLNICRRQGLEAFAVFRYAAPPLGMYKIARQERLYELTRMFFGTTQHNRNSRLGNEFIYGLKRI